MVHTFMVSKQAVHYLKQGQNKMLMKIMVDEIREKISVFVTKQKADAISFVPLTILSGLQIMKFIEIHLKFSLPVLKINKINCIILVPQKSLNKLEERITNAENTFPVVAKGTYKYLILIDDAVGS